jgi:DNA modification methylase
MKIKNMISQSSIKYDKNIDIRLLVTPYQNKRLPVYDWYSYKHSFSRDLVIKLIEENHLNGEDKILDPFCGSGTTLLASKEIGIPVQGIAILPLSVFISNSKLLRYDKSHIKNAINEIKDLFQKCDKYHEINDGKRDLLIKFFPEETLDKVLFIRGWINDKDDDQINHFFLTALLSILEDVSYTRKDGGFLRVLKGKKITDLKSVYLSKLYKMVRDIEFINNLPNTDAEAIEGDARKTMFEQTSFSAVITSPPYPNRHDYTRVYLLELVTGFIDTQEEIKTLRYHSVRSHVEARRKFIAEDYNLPNTLNAILQRLEEISLPNRQIIKMLEGYFEDMHLVLKEIKRLLRPNSKVAFIIGDVRYGGIKVPVGDILITLGNNIGLEFKEKITARMRGNSPQQMKKYGRDPIEENILIWERK